MSRCFYHTDLVQNAVVHMQVFKTNCIHSLQDHQSTRGLLAKPKSPISRFKLLTRAKFAKKF